MNNDDDGGDDDDDVLNTRPSRHTGQTWTHNWLRIHRSFSNWAVTEFLI